MLDDRLYRLADLQEFWLLDAFEVAVIFLVFASLHTCPLDTSVQLAVRSPASMFIFWISWTSWMGFDATSGVIASDDLGSLSCLFGIQDVNATFSQLVWEVPDVNQNLFDMSLFGSDLGDALNCDTVQSCVSDSDVNVLSSWIAVQMSVFREQM